MKSLRFFLCCLTAVVAVPASRLFAQSAYLGAIPVQYVNPGQELVLDMHRFYNPGARTQITAERSPDYTADFDAEKFELRVKLNENAAKLIDIPLSAAAKKGQIPGVLTIAVRPSQAGDESPAPSIYAERIHDHTLDVRFIAAGAPVKIVSATLELGNETSELPVLIDKDVVHIPLPLEARGFARVVAADADGRVSNVIRCPLESGSGFRWQDAVLYYALTDRFADGDKNNDHPDPNPDVLPPANYRGGDLRGIRQKIEEGYFDELGVNTIWLAPLNKNPDRAFREYPEPHRWYTGYHGYWPVSPTEIDPHFGTPEELKSLVASAHGHGMKVMADLVLHHVHTDHPWWKEHPDWFGKLELPDGRKNLRLWDEQQFTTWFEPFLPSFDFSKEAPTQALIDNTVWWAMEYDLDGFRLDAVKHILPQFWWKFRAALRERVDAVRGRPLYLVGETFKDRPGIASFVGPNMLDGQFDFPLYDVIVSTFARGQGGMKTLDSAQAQSERVFGKESLMSPLIGNHDKARFLAYADGEIPAGADGPAESEIGWTHPPKVDHPASYAELMMAQTYLLSIDGVPMIYYGDEMGMTGAGDPDNRRDMRFGDQVTSEEKGVLDYFKKLGQFRESHPALRYGSRRTVLAENNVYGFIRAHLDDRVLVLFNRSADKVELKLKVAPELADGDYFAGFSGQRVSVKDGEVICTLAGKSATFVVKAPKG